MPAECIHGPDGDLRIALDVPGFNHLPSDSREILLLRGFPDAVVRTVHRSSFRFHPLVDALALKLQTIRVGVAWEEADGRTGFHHGVLLD